MPTAPLAGEIKTGAANPGGRRIAVSEAVSLLVLISPPPETVALFATLPTALSEIFTVSVIGG
jgi:hypothetical protein